MEHLTKSSKNEEKEKTGKLFSDKKTNKEKKENEETHEKSFSGKDNQNNKDKEKKDGEEKSEKSFSDNKENRNNKDKDKEKKLKETFFARLIRKIIDNGIPTKKALNAVAIGYICGIILTIIWYNYFTSVELNTLRWACFIVIGFIILLLSYSKEVRCTATLAIPILCSTKGRSVIMALAFFLAATGPTVNIFRNIDVMVTSLTCGQLQLKQALSDMLDTLKKPLVAIKEAMRNVMKELKHVLKKVQAVLLKIKELVMLILAAIKNAFSWLENIVKMCNTEFGTPYQRCMNISDAAMQDCLVKIGPISGLCHLTHVFSMLCYAAKIVDVICVLVDFVNDAIIAAVIAKLEQFVNEIKKLFDVSITFEHDFYFQTTSSKELKQVRTDIMADIHRKMKTFILIFGWLDLMTLLLLVLIIIKAIYFRLKYVHNPGYQNCYITNEFVEIDEKRKSLKMETVLPLTFLETFKYPGLTDCRLTKKEWQGISRSSAFLVISTIQLFSICFADYCLYWILAMISFYGHKELGLEVPPYITVQVEGGGFVGEIFRGIVHAFEPVAQNYTTDSKTCLPNPRTPNFSTYYLIAIISLTAWIFLFCQPYGLRLRHIVMRLYYPEVARQRAVWLYNKILLLRTSFFKLARRKARLLFSKNSTKDNFSFLDWLRTRTEQYFICRSILGQRSKDKCILCGTPLDNDKRVKCETIGCSAIYCKNCFKESLNVCCLCNKPVEYGDFSDLSEVEDSSDDPDVSHVDETEKYCV